MSKKKISNGTVHKTPNDVKNILITNPVLYTIWEDITPLARNEWICWIESAKKEEDLEKEENLDNAGQI